MRRLLHEHTGINLGPQKQAMVRARLIKRLRAHGLTDFDAYLRTVTGPESPEWGPFVNALTTNLTSFFREQHHFEYLVAHYAAHPAPGGKLRVWSAGCSTGEEPYTLAMVLSSAFPDWDVRILATDVDTNVLETARRGVYPEERVDKLEREWKRYAFLKGTGPHGGKVRVRPELQAMVDFGILNLLGKGGWPEAGCKDVIFCRNVMIYFDKPTQKELLRHFLDVLAPGGFLFVGHSEALLDASLGFQSMGGTIYRKPGGA
ncbi:MAG TPA: protein-glutamate O-methyltransferase CheR [Holophagaceae bacterium]|nr:protein-glutamate O-methyltransferase CheR [Holophagaceae bacterium]